MYELVQRLRRIVFVEEHILSAIDNLAPEVAKKFSCRRGPLQVLGSRDWARLRSGLLRHWHCIQGICSLFRRFVYYFWFCATLVLYSAHLCFTLDIFVLLQTFVKAALYSGPF